MNDKPDRPIRSTASQAVWICAALGNIAFGVSGGVFAWEGWTSGQMYTIAVVFDDSRLASRAGSPGQYWAVMGCLGLSCITGLVIGILLLCEVATEHRRKTSGVRTNN